MSYSERNEVLFALRQGWPFQKTITGRKSTAFGGRERKYNLVQSICLSISSWCDKKLRDYHLHFSQKASIFEKVVTRALTVGSHNFDEYGHIKVTEKVSFGSGTDSGHPLALLANELRLIVERERSLYFPVLQSWYPEAAMVTAKKFHHFYGERLVEGETDKLSMDEVGLFNCVSVPDGSPQVVSDKELLSLEKDTRFQYLWNAKEYLDKVESIVLSILSMLSSPNDESPANVKAAVENEDVVKSVLLLLAESYGFQLATALPTWSRKKLILLAGILSWRRICEHMKMIENLGITLAKSLQLMKFTFCDELGSIFGAF